MKTYYELFLYISNKSGIGEILSISEFIIKGKITYEIPFNLKSFVTLNILMLTHISI